MTEALPNSFVGELGERIVEALALVIVGEPITRIGVGKGTRDSVDAISATWGIEIKTLLEGGEEKIRGSARARREKTAWVEVHGRRSMSVLVILDPARWRARVYRKEGFGPYRSGGMQGMGTFEVKRMLTPGRA